jgi:hypothetical protein
MTTFKTAPPPSLFARIFARALPRPGSLPLLPPWAAIVTAVPRLRNAPAGQAAGDKLLGAARAGLAVPPMFAIDG